MLVSNSCDQKCKTSECVLRMQDPAFVKCRSRSGEAKTVGPYEKALVDNAAIHQQNILK